MMKQYNEIKDNYQDSILLFRLGDFYEAFDKDAKDISKILGITLTGRGKGENRIPMAGIPYHALNNYLPKLIAAGLKVVIADQVSEPEQGKIVDREVTEVVTPGAIVDEKLLQEEKSNFLAFLFLDVQKKTKKDYYGGVCLIDVGTNEIKILEAGFYEIIEYIKKHEVKELIINEKAYKKLKDFFTSLNFPKVAIFNTIPEVDFNTKIAFKELKQKFNLNSFKSWGIENEDISIGLLHAVMRYLQEDLKKELKINNLQKIELKNQANIPLNTYQALEIFTDSQGGQDNTLFTHIDKTNTSMGRRKMQEYFLNVLIDKNKIHYRLNSVEIIMKCLKIQNGKEKWIDFLETQIDYDRFLTKFQYNKLKPFDLKVFAQAILKFADFQKFVKEIYKNNKFLNKSNQNILQEIQSFKLDLLLQKAQKFENAIKEAVNDLSKPGYINPEIDKELKKIVLKTVKANKYLEKLEETEKKQTNISSLKVNFNKVFGYYIEVTKTHLDKVPERYIRKQTLANSERYITKELKKWENIILSSEEKQIEKEREIFHKLILEIERIFQEIENIGKLIAEIDVLTSFAKVSQKYNYQRPHFVKNTDQYILKKIAHPVLSASLKQEYVKNDLIFDQNQKLHIITGPNMSGKSTYIRSVGLVQFLAQIGCFIPAESINMHIVDGIFCRVGASDNLAQNESTFMVEMTEMSYILKHASKDSLIILDEVGRGTSTYDGISLAWSLIEEISQKIKANTLFATHYHELIELENSLKGIKNFYVEAIVKGKLYFTHKVKLGSLDKSFGIEVAKMAGINNQVINRAKNILKKLEQENDIKGISKNKLNYYQPSLF